MSGQKDTGGSAGVLAVLGVWGSTEGQTGGRVARDTSVAAKIDVTQAQLTVAPSRENWPSYNGDYTGRRYTALKQITPENVKQLRAEWVFHARNSDSLEVTPV